MWLKFQQATYYGTPTSSSPHLLQYYFKKYPEDADKVVLTLKGAYGHATGPVGSAEGIRESVEDTLKILDNTKSIDVFILGRSVLLQSTTSIHVAKTL
jgi:pyridoxine 4-dehydrogenase